MFRYRFIQTLLLVGSFQLFSLKSALPQSLPIFIDGRFGDWSNESAVYVDVEGDGNVYDFKSFSVTNDEQFLFIRFTITPEIKLLENNSVTLYIDGDYNAASGHSVNGLGAELRWNFGARSGTFYRQSTTTLRYRHIQLRVLPTHTSVEYELAIGRDVRPDGVNSLFVGDSIRILFRDETIGGDMMPNDGEIFTYVFDPTPVEPIVPILLERNDTSYLRVMSYNVLNDGLADPARQPYYERILNAIQPEIICFNEMWNATATSAQAALDAILPLGPGKNWQTVKLDPGNVTVSRYPIKQSWRVLNDYRITASLIDLSEKGWGDVLVINAHFRCCTADSNRQLEADAVVEFLLDAKTPGGRITLEDRTPFMLVGDLNLVGFYQQLHTLLTGQIVNTGTFGTGGPPDWDGTDLADLISRQTDKRMAYTWRDDPNTFSPGRLDYFIHSNSVLHVKKSYILQTEVMPHERLQLYGLQQSDTRSASDHLPHVADFALRTTVNVSKQPPENPKSFQLEQNYPNPFNPTTRFEFRLPAGQAGVLSSELVSIKVYDVLGREAATLINEQKTPGVYTVTWNASHLASGVYFYRLTAGAFVETKKMVLLR